MPISVQEKYFTVAPDGTVNDGAGNTDASSADLVFYNYKTKVQDLGLQGIVSLNNIRFHKNKTGLADICWWWYRSYHL